MFVVLSNFLLLGLFMFFGEFGVDIVIGDV